MTQADDEYIDYSCSTPLERLARDIETTLRSWHVSLNDRHVSFQNNYSQQSNTHPRFNSNSKLILDANSRSSIGKNRGIQLIRSKEIVFYSFEKESIHLCLSLWDAPTPPANKSKLGESGVSSSLPLSLNVHPLSVGSFCYSNLSSLFGIGQHIVLTAIKTKALQTFSIKVDMMQMALNIATQNCYCQIPAFALPNEYEPFGPSVKSKTNVGINALSLCPPLMDVPKWLVPEDIVASTKHEQWGSSLAEEWTSSLASLSASSRNLLGGKKKSKAFSTALIPYNTEYDNSPLRKRQYFQSIFSGYCNPGPHWNDAGASFVLEYIPTYIPAHLQTVEDLACLLRHTCQNQNVQSDSDSESSQHSISEQDIKIHLEYVSYKYEWNKSEILARQSSLTSFYDQTGYYDKYEWRSNMNSEIVCDEGDSFEIKCMQHAMNLLQSSYTFSKSSEAQEEPMWGPSLDPVASIQVTLSWLKPPTPSTSLLSSKFSPKAKYSSDTHPPLFYPTQSPPNSFHTKCYWDRSLPCHSLSASMRCTLAAYLRSCTLHRNMLLSQLSNMSVLEELSSQCNENNEMEQKALKLSNSALGNVVTKRLVKAMDFKDAVDLPDREELKDRVDMILDGKHFPTIESEEANGTDGESHDDLYGREEWGINRAAPPGRLLSLLSLHMTQMQTPARMAALWLVFVEELRIRWEMRETLPFVNPIVGFDWMIDPNTNKTSAFEDKRANLAAFNHYTEPDPHHNYCLISQKLQVFNIGVETQIAAEEVWCNQQEQMREEEELHKQQQSVNGPLKGIPEDDDTNPPSACGASTTTVSETHVQGKDDDSLDVTKVNSDEEFYDSIDEEKPDTTLASDLFMRREESIAVIQRQQRQGARCPVNHTNLIASGDQLFAPYLQRPLPLTVDVLIQRKLMMMRQGSSTKSRMMIAQRLQKPKLLSDMKAFKAANPGAVFQDFMNWYGNPGGPFDGVLDYSAEEDDNATLFTAKSYQTSSLQTFSTTEPDDVNDAIEMLMSTRTFWSDTWDEAEPKPASQQQPPLFDPSIEVEMVLNYFDTMHPSQLLNQILAVNFTNANFILRATAGDALNVKTVRFALERLEERTKYALDKLEESLHANMFDDGDLTTHEALSASEAVCDAIGDVEVLLARATSLLHKFHGDFDTVQKLLRKRDGEEIPMQSSNGRLGILKTVWKHQKPRAAKASKVWRSSAPTKGVNFYPDPMVQEYILRNSDYENPFQLSAVIKETGTNFSTQKKGYSKDGSVLLAMKRCERE